MIRIARSTVVLLTLLALVASAWVAGVDAAPGASLAASSHRPRHSSSKHPKHHPLTAKAQVATPDAGVSSVPGLVPLTDMGAQEYIGLGGGLYPGGSNDMPDDHHRAGLAHESAIQPLDKDGSPSDSGKIVFLSIGMSNAALEFCGKVYDCNDDPTSESFMGQAADSDNVDHSALVLVNGAQGEEDAHTWDSPDDSNYDMVRDDRLHASGVTEKQVQIVWLNEADARPSVSLPSVDADAYTLEGHLGDIVRALKSRYPNLQQVFLASRIYGGYSTGDISPEPFAYETGFAVKWLIRAQIVQMGDDAEVTDTHAGDLDYTSVAPWLAWGPYLWADGTQPRQDGLTWEESDFLDDGLHPSPAGVKKVADHMMEFFSSSPFTHCWFTADGCPGSGPGSRNHS